MSRQRPRHLIYPDEWVDNEQLRRVVQAWIISKQGTWSDLCRHAGMITEYGPQTTELQRQLGILKSSRTPKSGTQYMHYSIRRKTALKLLDYMGYDPVDVDL